MSKSVARGLKFYLDNGYDEFIGCEENIEFCLKFNDTFDALNLKMCNDGLTPTSKHYKVIFGYYYKF